MNLDPASAMLQEYNKTGKGQTKSPSRKAKQRAASGSAMADLNANEKTELSQYLS